jgi:hypothetical protein
MNGKIGSMNSVTNTLYEKGLEKYEKYKDRYGNVKSEK